MQRGSGVSIEILTVRMSSHRFRSPFLAVILCLFGTPVELHAADSCGQLISVATHGDTTTRYALAHPATGPRSGQPVVLVLLAGGGGHLDLDDDGCPRSMKGNSLVRSIPHFHAAGFSTALVDAVSDQTGDDGLSGFRIHAKHAEDLGKVIADVRTRAKSAVWLVGTSRGTISAVNTASRLSGSSAPDGLVLTSPITSGDSRARKSWVAHTVFSLPLEAIRMPVLVVGHADDKCVRTPPAKVSEIIERTEGAREQAVTVTGGSGWQGGPGLKACRGKAPHGFSEQEAEVAAGIARFIRGGKY